MGENWIENELRNIKRQVDENKHLRAAARVDEQTILRMRAGLKEALEGWARKARHLDEECGVEDAETAKRIAEMREEFGMSDSGGGSLDDRPGSVLIEEDEGVETVHGVESALLVKPENAPAPPSGSWRNLMPNRAAIFGFDPLAHGYKPRWEASTPEEAERSRQMVDSALTFSLKVDNVLEAAINALLSTGIDFEHLSRWRETSSADCGIMVDGRKACTVSVTTAERGSGFFIDINTTWHGEWERLGHAGG